ATCARRQRFESDAVLGNGTSGILILLKTETPVPFGRGDFHPVEVIFIMVFHLSMNPQPDAKNFKRIKQKGRERSPRGGYKRWRRAKDANSTEEEALDTIVVSSPPAACLDQANLHGAGINIDNWDADLITHG
ncbi:hypothetical protein BaRGS_00007849, partial [Batillaria attramentaria]